VTSPEAHTPLRVLLLEDDAAEAELITRELERAGVAHVAERVETEAAFMRGLRRFAPDVVLSDHALAQFDALAVLKTVRAQRPGTPVIVVTGTRNEQRAVECLKAGAEDYVLKENLARLGPTITTALSVRKPLRSLSPRQYEVLLLIAQGYGTREIARRLELGVKTIETHRAAVMKRLDLHDVASLVRFAIRVGMIAAAP